MLKSKLNNVLLSVLTDHLDEVMDLDDIESLSKDLSDEISHRFREVEDDDNVFKANDIELYDDED